MVFTNAGLKEVKKWLAGHTIGQVHEIVLGESGTADLETDTALGSIVGTTSKAFSSVTETDYTVGYEHLLSTGEGNGFDFRELGFMCYTAGTSLTDTVLFGRHTYPVINKTESEEMQTTITIKVDNEV